jgi:hypothetical protein
MLEYRYDVPFRFTGKINKLTFKLEPKPEAAPPKLSHADIQKRQQAQRNNKTSE